MYLFYSITKALICVTVILPMLGDSIKPVLQEKVESTIRKIIFKKPLKIQSQLSS